MTEQTSACAEPMVRYRHGDEIRQGRRIAKGRHGVTVRRDDGRVEMVLHDNVIEPEPDIGEVKP